MNAIEIEEAISVLAEQSFQPSEFPYLFLEAFGNKETTLKRLRSGGLNKSDLGGVLQANNIHIVVCKEGDVSKTLLEIGNSLATKKGKVKFGLATDGESFEAEDYNSGETVVCDYINFPNHFGFFLPLAGISTVKQIRDNAFDIKATSRLNRLYLQLLSENPDWVALERRPAMNHFMARLIFCFFAEDTNIFRDSNLFTQTIDQMSQGNVDKTHEVISEIFRSMNTKIVSRTEANISRWADAFPYVNGGLFAGDIDCPKFSKLARSYLLHIGNLDWTKINPDIFGSMIQAIADDEERGELGMHYTSVPNILKVLNPLFLDDLRKNLKECGDNSRKLLNLRKRISRIRVFDPACGSGNFLVIAYRELRTIEHEINERRGEAGRKTDIPITNFRGIELRGFSAEIARLALIIAEYQCDVTYLGQKEALVEFLPLSTENWITCGNALRLDWLSICPPTGAGVKYSDIDLFETLADQSEIDFENEGGETYICGNPPYVGSKRQGDSQKSDLEFVAGDKIKKWKSLDYVAGWFLKAADYSFKSECRSAFVATNSVCQGQHVSILWKTLFDSGIFIDFAYESFKWSNLASNKAGVTVVIVGMSRDAKSNRSLFWHDDSSGSVGRKVVENINGYLVAAPNITIEPRLKPNDERGVMQFGNHPYYGAGLVLSKSEAEKMIGDFPVARRFIKAFYGSKEFIDNSPRSCLWIEEEVVDEALSIPPIASRVKQVKEARLAASKDKTAQKLAETPFRFREQMTAREFALVIPRISSENREYLPIGILNSDSIVQEKAFVMFDSPLWNLALIASRIHWVWIGTVCVRMRTDFSYSNTLGWNTFPIPKLTEKNKLDLTRSAENIILARESHFPSTIGELYDPIQMPQNLREAHRQNDEIVERIFIGRRFRNDTERLEKLFSFYT